MLPAFRQLRLSCKTTRGIADLDLESLVTRALNVGAARRPAVTAQARNRSPKIWFRFLEGAYRLRQIRSPAPVRAAVSAARDIAESCSALWADPIAVAVPFRLRRIRHLAVWARQLGTGLPHARPCQRAACPPWTRRRQPATYGHGAVTVSPTASRGPRCRSGPARRATRRSGRAPAATRNRPRHSAARDTRASSWSPSVATSGLAQTARDAECSSHRNEVQEIGILARRARLRVEAFGGRNTCTVFRAR